jgi:tetratricopeptide (TPR) repeat protein
VPAHSPESASAFNRFRFDLRKSIALVAAPVALLLSIQSAFSLELYPEFVKARTLYRTGHGGQAQKMLLRICSYKEATPEMVCLLADSYLADGAQTTNLQLTQAQKLVDRALRADPEWGNAWKISADLANNAGNPAQAITLATKALTVKHPDLSGLYQRALAYDQLDKSKESLSDITTYIEKHDHSSDMWIVKANFLRKAKRIDDAIAAYRMAQKETYRDWTVFQIADCYEGIGRNTEAIKEVSGLIRLNARDPEAFQVRARLEGKAKMYKEAISDYSQAISIEPNARFYRERAELYKVTGQKAAAEDDIKKAAKFDSVVF